MLLRYHLWSFYSPPPHFHIHFSPSHFDVWNHLYSNTKAPLCVDCELSTHLQQYFSEAPATNQNPWAVANALGVLDT